MPAGPLISIIDDDESLLGAIAVLLRSAGYDARGFASAEEFLGCGMVPSFACIITDVQMPGMSGIPVIMITARHDRIWKTRRSQVARFASSGSRSPRTSLSTALKKP